MKKKKAAPSSEEKKSKLLGLHSYPAISFGIVVKDYDVLHVDAAVSRKKLEESLKRATPPVIALVNGLGELPKIKGLNVRPIVFDSLERLQKAGVEVVDAVQSKDGVLKAKVRSMMAKDIIALARAVAQGEKWEGPSEDSLTLSIPVVIKGSSEPKKAPKQSTKKPKKIALIDWDTVDAACSTVTAQLTIPKEKRLAAITDIRNKMRDYILGGEEGTWNGLVEKLEARGVEEDTLDVLTSNVMVARTLIEAGPASDDPKRKEAAKALSAALKKMGKVKIKSQPVVEEPVAVTSSKPVKTKGAALPVRKKK